jgi:DNA-binding XRE family transcriptional regulator
MAVETGSALTSIGDCLRATREEQGLTLEQAAELSGISKSHLSRLESPSASPRWPHCSPSPQPFGVPVGAFFGETQGRRPLAISKPDEPRRESNGSTIAPCSGYAGSSVIDALRVTVDPGRPAPVPTRHPGEEWIYVLSGTLRLEYDGEAISSKRGTRPTSTPNCPTALGPRGRPPRCCWWRPNRFATCTRSTSPTGGTMTVTDVTTIEEPEAPSTWTASWPSGPGPARPST